MTFCFELYKEWSDLDDIIVLLKDSNHTFLAISPLHDKDLKEDGSPVKPHYHGIISFPSQVWAFSFCRQFHINVMPQALKNKFGNRTGAILYLTHSDDKSRKEGKVQYPYEDIWTDKWAEVEAVYKRPVVYKPDIVDTCDFLSQLGYMIQAHYFKNELQIALYCVQNGYEKLFHKYKFQIHSDFQQASSRLSAENKKNKSFKEI